MLEQKQYETPSAAAEAVQAWAKQARARGEDLSRLVAFIDCEERLVTLGTRRRLRKAVPAVFALPDVRRFLSKVDRACDLAVCSYDGEHMIGHVYTPEMPCSAALRFAKGLVGFGRSLFQ